MAYDDWHSSKRINQLKNEILWNSIEIGCTHSELMEACHEAMYTSWQKIKKEHGIDANHAKRRKP
jgi:hypothetical protein